MVAKQMRACFEINKNAAGDVQKSEMFCFFDLKHLFKTDKVYICIVYARSEEFLVSNFKKCCSG